MTAGAEKSIRIRGASQHNLCDIDVEIPRDRLVVVTGVSGSGKSSLAFDTVFAEGQRKYMESLSAYARQFLQRVAKPDVESIEGLPPTIAIAQRSGGHNPRSTVATTTEIYDFLRLLMARCGTPRCWHRDKSGRVCGQPISPTSATSIIDAIMDRQSGTRVMLCGPVISGRKGFHREVLDDLRSRGFVRARVDGSIIDIREALSEDSDNPLGLGRYEQHDIEAVVDRLTVCEGDRERMADSVEIALKVGSGSLMLLVEKDGEWEEHRYSEHFACPSHPRCSLSELEPRLFSFNSPYGACQTCDGMGLVHEFDSELVIPDPSLGVTRGAVVPWRRSGPQMNRRYARLLRRFCDKEGIDGDTPFSSLTKQQKQTLMHGGTGSPRFRGVIPDLKKRLRQTESDHVRNRLLEYMKRGTCPTCEGNRLRQSALSVTVRSGGEDFRICDLTHLTIGRAIEVFDQLELDAERQTVADPIQREIASRLRFLASVGLQYLSLDRSSGTLSGGEAQRIRLATQVGSGLVGVCYVLDEPTIGLHARDNARLIRTLRHLSDIGNTVLIVEHDESMIRAADDIIDIGPGAGRHGGRVIAQGNAAEIEASDASLTGAFLSGRRTISIPLERRVFSPRRAITVRGARRNNLRNLDVRFPIGLFTCVTGVSGSGKSSLVNDVLLAGVRSALADQPTDRSLCTRINGLGNIDRVIQVDQSPIGRTPRSNPATYTGILDGIRARFADTREARIRGYKPGRFSFNVKGGRCEECQGQGVKRIEMHFLPDTFVTCEACHGRRYNPETLEIRWRDMSIADVLNTTISDACEIFEAHGRISRMLQCLQEVGLGYLTLGQPSTTLSGGEAQRVKLASELGTRTDNHTLYVLDEPTTGLHFADVERLLGVVQRLVDAGNTIVVIEHNLDVIKSADWVIDLGPDGGDAGGDIVAEGTPEAIAEIAASHTGSVISEVLGVETPAVG
ncbi:MAG: excinuclease ABC subunit UvrA [Phycisphaerales bacterium]|nr:excinuclease ABC subunit UvrA [Phycisphaerales bacterium]